MSIKLYSGVPGSGKSYHAVSDIVFAVRQGKYVYTNIELDYAAVAKCCRKKLDFVKQHIFYKDTYDITISDIIFSLRPHAKAKKEHQFLLVIDEAGDIFNPREWKSPDRLDWLKFFRLHRHFYIDVILIAQDDEYVDKQIRGVIELEGQHVNVRYYKTLGFFLSLIFGGLFVCHNKMYQTRLKNDNTWIIRRRKISKCYDTFSLAVDYYAQPSAFLGASSERDNQEQEERSDNTC